MSVSTACMREREAMSICEMLKMVKQYQPCTGLPVIYAGMGGRSAKFGVMVVKVSMLN